MRRNPGRAAVLMLAALAVQVAAAVCLGYVSRSAGLALMVLCWLTNAWAAWDLRCYPALAAALIGCALEIVVPNGTDPAWIGNILINLLFLLVYLPMQLGFDRALDAVDASAHLRGVGRVWAMAALIQRGASMMGFAPFFEGQAELSVQQGQYTVLLLVQMALEMVALLAAIVAYIWMIRYLWRAKTLLKEQVEP